MENMADEDCVALICNGEFNAIPNFKIGELFESFFDNINYNVVRKEENIFVDFTGDAMCDNEPCTILMRFKVECETEEFEIIEVRVNEEVLSEDETLDLLEDIAYVGGATIESDCCCDCNHDDCSHCSHEDEEDDDNNENDDDSNNKDDEK